MPAVPLLELENLLITRSRSGAVEPLVQNLSLRLENGESLGLIGASGSGKSLTVLALLHLLPEPEIRLQSGRIRFQGQDLQTLSPREMNDLRGSRMAVIVQDALAALNPVRRIKQQMAEIFRFHGRPCDEDRLQLCLQRAGLPEVDRILQSYPHELSGGMRQRVLLAMALLLEPDLLIADEPTTALDVTLQARWVEQIQQLRQEQKLGLLFISHDLGLVADVCERIAVLYCGHLVETASTEDIIKRPLHPYTQAMLKASPLPEQGTISKQGCPFAALCPQVMPICRQTVPTLSGSHEHRVACHAVKN